MPGRIRILGESVINRIAAGEVIERPVSVVKELVENSLDAQASSIKVEIESGGRRLIRVSDDGVGMSHDDAFLALERHATSKLASEKDLHGIATLGFRGEALASVASISRLRLLTRDDSDSAGTEIVIEGGVLRKSGQIGMGRGTTIEVANLFYNVPVRRKFLKSGNVEAGYVQELITKLALAFTSVAFTYSEEGRVKLAAPPVKSTFERIHTLYSKDVRDNLAEVDYQLDEARLRGYVAKPPYARSSLRSVLTFVNGRTVRDRLINAAVTRAFSNLVERGRYPLAILFIEVPADQVDVNVHPQKAEVRFLRPREISDLILDGVHQAVVGVPFSQPKDGWRTIFPTSPVAPLSRHLAKEERIPEAETPYPISPTPVLPQRPPTDVAEFGSESGRFSSLGVLGRIPGSFLVLYSDDELIIMDHHAAHERVVFDELTRSYREGETVASQDLLIPKLLEYSATEARALALHLDMLRQTGFRVEEFGENDFLVKGVPPWLGNADLQDVFNELIDLMLDTGLRGDPARLQQELLKSVACKAAVKEKETLHSGEIHALLSDLDRNSSPEVCPHGRPMTVRIPLSEIRRKTGRR
jgi:DNA mismatch repair protein MutL